MKSIYIFLILSLFLIACSSNKELIEVRPEIIQPDTIEGVLPADQMAETDTVIITKEIIRGDTVKYIEFKPDPQLMTKIRELQKESKEFGKELKSLGEFYFKFKPDPILKIDTVRTVKTIVKETPLLSKLGLVSIGVAIGLILLVILNLYRRKFLAG